MRNWIVSLGLIFLLAGCAQSTAVTSNHVSVSQDTNVPVSSSSQPVQSQAVTDWQQYANDTTDFVHQFMTIRTQYEQFISDANAGKYDSTQIISTLGTLQTQMVSLKMNVDTYMPSQTVYDTHQLFIKAVDDLYNAMQGISDAQVEQNIDQAQYKRDISNANAFSQRSTSEMTQYLTQETSQMKQAEGSGS